MLCLLVGKQSTYCTVSPVTGAGVTRRYWILVAGALGSGRLSPAWHSCGLLGGAPLLPRCTLQGGRPGVKLVWQTPGPHQAGGGPSPLQPALLVSASTPPYTLLFPKGISLVRKGPVFLSREKRFISSQRKNAQLSVEICRTRRSL